MSTTTRRRWGVPVSQHMQRFGRRGENGPKNNAAAAAACCCLVWFPPGPREREREGEGPPPSFSTPPTTEFVSRESIVDSSNRRLPPRSPSSSFLLSSFSPSRRATSFWGGPRSLGVLLPWRGKGIYRCCWWAGVVSMGVGGFGGVLVVGTHLDEANVGGLLAEALTADVEAVLADETGLVGADAAVGGGDRLANWFVRGFRVSCCCCHGRPSFVPTPLLLLLFRLLLHCVADMGDDDDGDGSALTSHGRPCRRCAGASSRRIRETCWVVLTVGDVGCRSGLRGEGAGVCRRRFRDGWRIFWCWGWLQNLGVFFLCGPARA